MFTYNHGRFTSPDPYNVIFEKEDAEREKEGRGQKLFSDYISQPQNWNRYVYVWNNPLRNIDPTGEDVYVIVYTTGNTEGDDEFKRVAETRANDIRNSKGFDPKKDTVIVRGAKTLDDVQSALNEAKDLEGTYGRVQQFALISHGGPTNGPIFEFRVIDRQNQPEEKIFALKINWAKNGEAYFLGCNTASFAQRFANNHMVSTWGFTTGTTFYSDKEPFLSKGTGLSTRIGAYDYIIFDTPLYMKSQGDNPNGNFVRRMPGR